MERLELLLAYLRRVLCFDFGSGQQYKEAAALLKEGGELHLGARLCVHQPPPEARMAPFASAPRHRPPAAGFVPQTPPPCALASGPAVRAGAPVTVRLLPQDHVSYYSSARLPV